MRVSSLQPGTPRDNAVHVIIEVRPQEFQALSPGLARRNSVIIDGREIASTISSRRSQRCTPQYGVAFSHLALVQFQASHPGLAHRNGESETSS